MISEVHRDVSQMIMRLGAYVRGYVSGYEYFSQLAVLSGRFGWFGRFWSNKMDPNFLYVQ